VCPEGEVSQSTDVFYDDDGGEVVVTGDNETAIVSAEGIGYSVRQRSAAVRNAITSNQAGGTIESSMSESNVPESIMAENMVAESGGSVENSPVETKNDQPPTNYLAVGGLVVLIIGMVIVKGMF
jgi:hypothetical protein